MLEDKSVCWTWLRCPRTHRALELADDHLKTIGDPDTRYPVVLGIPVLVDFPNSVIDQQAVMRTAGGSQIKRQKHHGPAAIAKRLVSPPKQTTSRNIGDLIDLLLQRSSRPRVLVIGGGTIGQGLRPLYDHPDISVCGFDIYYSEYVQFIADGHKIPIADQTFDGVVVQAVLEHVLRPDQVVSEIWRVLKPEGLVYAETPFMQQVHEGPYDFTRFTDSGHRYLFRRFALIRSGASGNAGTQLLWSLDYFARSLFRSRAAGKAAKLAFFWLHYVDRLIPNAYAVDAASGVFFLGAKADSEISPKAAVAHYQGAQ
jgi:SAM-dependent methyltransferase